MATKRSRPISQPTADERGLVEPFATIARTVPPEHYGYATCRAWSLANARQRRQRYAIT